MKADGTLPKAAPQSAPLGRAARVVAFPSPWAPQRKTAGIGVALACGAVVMWYLPLFGTALRMRFVEHDWPASIALGLAYPWSAAAVGAGLLSAIALTFAARGTAIEAVTSADQPVAERLSMFAWPAGLIASAAFSAASVVFHYRTCTSLAAGGLDLRSGPAGSVLFGFVMLDLAAMAVGTVAILFMVLRLLRGRWHPARPLPTTPWSVYLRCAAGVAALGFIASFVGA